MELFRRNLFVKTKVEETSEPVFTPVEAVDSEEEPRNLLMLASFIIAALAFAILIAAMATWLYHKAHKPAPAPASTEQLPMPPPQDLHPGG